MDDNASFGYWVRRRRKALDLTQDALAQQVACSVMTIRKIEGDMRRPSRQIAERLAECLAIPTDQRGAFIKSARAELAVDQLRAPVADLAMQAAHIHPPASSTGAGSIGAADLAHPNTTPDQHQTNLPLQPTALIGREHEVARVGALLRSSGTRLLTLTGPGGTGKTRLALQVAAELLDSFADGVYLVALAPIRDPALVIETIAATLGVKEGSDQPLLSLLKRHVRDKQLLLVLDNFEQVIDAAPQVAELFETAPRLKVLVTSRACLQIYGEAEFPVPPLALPDPKRLPPLERLTQYNAIQLFIERARAVKPDFTVNAENAPAVAEICVRLDGLPLAIELAAVRVKVLTPQALLTRLSHRLQVLTGGARNLPARQQTLRDTIAWSHELLPEAQQRLFARLAVFAGGCTLEAAEAVCNTDGDVALDTLDSIQALVNNSLVRQEVGVDADPRLNMLETIREYALEQLIARGEEATLCARHAAYYLEVVEAGKPKLDTAEQEVWLERLEAEHDNLRAALAWALGRGDPTPAMRMSVALWRFWEMRGYFTEGRRWLSAVLERSDNAGPALQAAAYGAAGTMAYHQRDHTQAIQWHQHALDLYRLLDDKSGIAFALNNLGVQSLEQGDFTPAMHYLSESLALTQQLGQTRTSAYTSHNMGELARWQDDHVRAAELYTQSLAVFRTLGDHWAACYSLVGLGKVAGYQGDDLQATRLYLEALSLCQEQGHRELLAECLDGLAGSAARQGQGLRATRLFSAAEQLRVEIDAPRPVVESQWYVATVELARAALDPATFEGSWMAGRRMPIEEAIAYAMSHNES